MNQAYTAEVGPLKNPGNDVALIAAALGRIGFELKPPLRDASREQILSAVHDFADRLKAAGPSSVGFLYYAGHGAALAGENLIVPVNVKSVNAREVAVAGVKISEITGLLNDRAPQAAHFVVFDACRNNLGGVRGGKGFLPTIERPGTLVAFSTAPGATASDEGKEVGPYALALASEIVVPGRNYDDVFFEVRRRVAELTNQEQIPWTQDGLLRSVRFRSEKEPGASEQSTEAAQVWEVTKDTTNRALLETFIARYSDSFYAEMARGRLRQFQEGKQDSSVGIRLWGFASFDLQCNSNLSMPLEVVSKPSFGTVSFRDEEITSPSGEHRLVECRHFTESPADVDRSRLAEICPQCRLWTQAVRSAGTSVGRRR